LVQLQTDLPPNCRGHIQDILREAPEIFNFLLLGWDLCIELREQRCWDTDSSCGIMRSHDKVMVGYLHQDRWSSEMF
jgi:hypothetical protein